MTTREAALAALQVQWGAEYEIWVVPLSVGGEKWCARRHGAPVAEVMHAYTPEHLAEYLADAELAP